MSKQVQKAKDLKPDIPDDYLDSVPSPEEVGIAIYNSPLFQAEFDPVYDQWEAERNAGLRNELMQKRELQKGEMRDPSTFQSVVMPIVHADAQGMDSLLRRAYELSHEGFKVWAKSQVSKLLHDPEGEAVVSSAVVSWIVGKLILRRKHHIVDNALNQFAEDTSVHFSSQVTWDDISARLSRPYLRLSEKWTLECDVKYGREVVRRNPELQKCFENIEAVWRQVDFLGSPESNVDSIVEFYAAHCELLRMQCPSREDADEVLRDGIECMEKEFDLLLVDRKVPCRLANELNVKLHQKLWKAFHASRLEGLTPTSGSKQSTLIETESGAKKYNSPLAKNIDKYRTECGFSIEVLAEKVGINASSVKSHLKGGGITPKVLVSYVGLFNKHLSTPITASDLKAE